MKSKGERERYTQLKTELQKTARRDKKTFLNKQCKEAEENNKMERTRDLFKKIGDFRGTFHARMGMIKDRNENLREPKEIKKRWKNIQKNYTKNVFMTQITMMAWSLTKSQTSWTIKPSGLQEALL